MKLWLKIVTIGLFLFAVVPVIVLLGMHFRPHAGRLETTIEIARPREQVWGWVSDPNKVTKWVGWLTAIEPDARSPEGVGHREVWVMGDPHAAKPLHIPAEVTAWEPPHSMSGRIVMSDGFDGQFTYTLEEIGGHTRLHHVSDWQYHGIGWLLEPLVTPEAQKKMVADLARLKSLAEAEPVATN